MLGGEIEPIANIVKLPDGRIAIENARNQKDITRDELMRIPYAVRLWWEIMWKTHFPGEQPEADLGGEN